jgi:hypothetical protein
MALKPAAGDKAVPANLFTAVLALILWMAPMGAGGAGPPAIEDERAVLDAVHHVLYREWKALGEARQRLVTGKRALHEELREIHGDTEAGQQRRREIREALADHREKEGENRDAFREHRAKKQTLDRLKKAYLMKNGSD